ncbi:hypothetical protein LUD75_13705 [Epilithonimonas sp. JDS]|uniref:hypothetical protein n=1 Tax=Epilithonimonas sp. JDS TaxID=2902797 RepID=UPI001E3A1A66|nr:hypothetical protein [Epilithonimonas sp. JDS]MCD9855774.1 hypothetical protein [Epilithonimonas sp. JDS]
MIRIKKPSDIPAKLLNEGVAENNKNCVDYDKPGSTLDSTGFDIGNKIYGHSSVKKILKNSQHNKCCFCEKDQVDEFGAVEHFRPKKGYKINKKDKLIRPGYYWLAFDWDNLFFVCSGCNSTKYKGNRFPIVDEKLRAKNHHADYKSEESLLLHPSGDHDKNPERHITFEGPLPKELTKFGKATIEICGLDRDALNNKRKKLLEDIDARIAIIGFHSVHSAKEISKAKKYIRDCQNDEAEFSSAARAYLKTFNFVTN